MTHARILVVDDDDAIRTLLRLVASRAGFEVDVASDGKQAMSLITTNQYHVMLLDLMMPVMSGYEVLEQLDNVPTAPPVVIVSAMADGRATPLDSRRVQGIVNKPFDVEQIVHVLTSIVRAFEPQPTIVPSEEDDGLIDLAGIPVC